MNVIMTIPQEQVDEQLQGCADGETGDFTLTGATFTVVPGVGAVVHGDTVSKSGGAETPKETALGEEMPLMSPTVKAVVGRKTAP
jgi:hypothetical protein